ncbi:MAG: hypothetical protein JWO30_4178 [Fibrobacteres bacterium]|nr:hypothetical protein [Fibrobacterota bacterium]
MNKSFSKPFDAFLHRFHSQGTEFRLRFGPYFRIINAREEFVTMCSKSKWDPRIQRFMSIGANNNPDAVLPVMAKNVTRILHHLELV